MDLDKTIIDITSLCPIDEIVEEEEN